MERILAALRPRWRAPLKAKPVRHARRPSIGSYPSRIRTGRARAFELRSGKRKGNPKRRARMKESPRPGRETNARRATTPCGLRRKGRCSRPLGAIEDSPLAPRMRVNLALGSSPVMQPRSGCSIPRSKPCSRAIPSSAGEQLQPTLVLERPHDQLRRRFDVVCPAAVRRLHHGPTGVAPVWPLQASARQSHGSAPGWHRATCRYPVAVRFSA
jgi:hypothetical protein